MQRKRCATTALRASPAGIGTFWPVIRKVYRYAPYTNYGHNENSQETQLDRLRARSVRLPAASRRGSPSQRATYLNPPRSAGRFNAPRGTRAEDSRE